MNKYFVFRKEEVTESSITSSDSGVGMSVFAVSADKIAYLSAEKGKIFIAFNNATVYENVNLLEGDFIQKSSVTIGCPEGQELKFVEDIVNFISGEKQRRIMKFDVIDDKSTFKLAELSKPESIEAKIGTRAVNLQTKKISTGVADKYDVKSGKFVTKTTIAEIDFLAEENLPSFDVNHEGLASFADGDTITKWRNDGTKGAAFNITRLGTTTPSCETASSTSGIGKKSANIANSESFDVPSFSTKGDYTLYCVIGEYRGNKANSNPMVLYGDVAGETIGFGGIHPPAGELNEATLAKSRKPYSFSVRHSTRLGAPATTQTDTKEKGTISFRWPSFLEAEGVIDDMGGPDVFIIRRDKKFNMFLHNRDGDVIGFIPAKTINDDKKFTTLTDGLTDGALLIENLGTVKDFTTAAAIVFSGHLARFGVIERDIGTDNAAQLCRDLFDLYKII